MDIVEVEWVDSHMSHGWQEEHSLNEIPTLHSVGYVRRDDEHGIWLVESVVQLGESSAVQEKYGCTGAIPRSAIRKVTKLGPKKENGNG